MNLILWRHAEAEDGRPDLVRPLTDLGRRQAERTAAWLHSRLPPRFLLVSSPAERARATAAALQSASGVTMDIDPRLAPGGSVDELLALADWPMGPGHGERTVVVVGHQPTLGRTASRLVAGRDDEWNVRRGGLWWVSLREHDGLRQVVVQAVIGPELA